MQQLDQQVQVVETPVVAPATPWGFWPTVGLGLAIFFAWSMVQGVTAIIISGGFKPGASTGMLLSGRAISWAAIVGLPVVLVGVILLARARKGISLPSYLGLTWPPARQVVGWTLAMVAFLVGNELLGALLHRPPTQAVVSWYATSGWLPIFLFGVVVAAPLGEEFFFRGFLYAGMSKTRGGPVLAIVLISLIFAAQHIQYDLFDMTSILVVALLLGVVRWRTGSLWLCVALHMLMNAASMTQIALTISK